MAQPNIEISINPNVDCVDSLDARRRELLTQLMQEFEPVGAVENILIAELARRAINMERSAAAIDRIRNVNLKILTGLSFQPAQRDALLASANSCGAMATAERTGFAESRAFSRALHLLMHLQNRRGSNHRSPLSLSTKQFATEEACLDYLIDWKQKNFRCRRCGEGHAYYIRARLCVECKSCGRQAGLRADTILADSPLALVTWFRAIIAMINDPSIKTADLQNLLGLHRTATVRVMARKIRGALAAEDRNLLLVGLDHVCSQPELSAPSNTIFHAAQHEFSTPGNASPNPSATSNLRRLISADEH